MDDQLLGFLIVVIESVDEGDVHLIERYRQYGVVTDLYVAEEARHQGIAGRLIEAAERHVRQAGLSRLLITTLAQKPSRSRGLCTTRLQVLYSHDV